MAVPSKAEQDAEARGRAESGVDPHETANALNVIDDGATAPSTEQHTRSPAEAGNERAQRPAPTVRSASDDKRNAIIARFRANRGEEAAQNTDEISDFTRSGMPPEFAEPNAPVIQEPEPEPPAAEVEAAPAPAPTPQRVKLKVNGQEIEMSLEEAIAKAQIAVAADNVLDQAKSRLREVDNMLANTRTNLARPEQPGANQTGQNETQQTEQRSTDGTVPANQGDDITKLIEAMQFGDPADARTLFEDTIQKRTAAAVTPAVQAELQNQRLRDEGARTAKVLEDFKAKHADLADDPMANVAIERKVYDLQLDDLRALGVDANQIPTAHGGPPTPGDIALAHRWYRANGFQVMPPETMLEKATEAFLQWKGVAKPTQEPANPAPNRASPRIDVSVDRTARRAAIPQQPSRAASPKPDAQRQPAPSRDRSSVVQQEMQRRNLPRGRVVA